MGVVRLLTARRRKAPFGPPPSMADAPYGFEDAQPLGVSNVDLQNLAATPRIKGPNFWHRSSMNDTGFGFADVLGIVGDALTAAGGGQPMYGPELQHHLDARIRAEEEERKRFAPQQVGGHIVQLQHDGTYKDMFRPDEGFEIYAKQLGLTPGTEEWNNAITDYRLLRFGPSATQSQMNVDDNRTEGRLQVVGAQNAGRAKVAGINASSRENVARTRAGSNEQVATIRANAPRGGGQGRGIVTVKTREEALGLPKGTVFRTPDGRTLVR